MNKFELEKLTVIRFLNNQGIDCENFIFLKKDEPCDVYCENINQEFQVTWNEHEFQNKIHTIPSINGVKFIDTAPKKLDQVVNDFIVEPILKKVKRFKESAKDIILLVTAKNDFSPSSGYFEKGKNEILKETIFFKEIYIVCPNKNIKIF